MKQWWVLVLVLLLAACNTRPASNTTPGGGKKLLGLVKVTIDLRDEATPNATAVFVPMARALGGVNSQAITGRDDDIRMRRKDASFLDFADSPPFSPQIRYISATFEIANKSSFVYNNLSLIATSFASGPLATKNGTTFTSLSDATGAAISLSATLPGGVNVYRGLQPTHAMRRGSYGSISPVVDPDNADLQLFTPAESQKVQTDLASAYPGAQVMGYGFVARNFTGGRSIPTTPANCDEITDPSCLKGQITLAFKFPRLSTRASNPFVFSMVFLVADETGNYVSQSLEEQADFTAAGITTVNLGVFTQVRTLFGTFYAGANKTDLCKVVTAVSTATFPVTVHMPTNPGC